MAKMVFILNGSGGSGKDSVASVLGRHYKVVNESSITPIKLIAREYTNYDESVKSDKDRKFLSDLKTLFVNYCNLPNTYLVNRYNEFLKSDADIFIAHIREGSEIDKFKKSIDGKAITLLVTGGRSKSSYGNKSDDDVFNYDYDYTFINSGTLENLDSDFMKFFNSILLEEERKSYPHNEESFYSE